MSSGASDITQTINMLVSQTVGALNERRLRDVPTTVRHLKCRIWEYFRIDAARNENASLPIQRLPMEIFLICVGHYLAFKPARLYGMTHYSRLHTLSSVCWSWKCTIDNAPALWSWIGPWRQSEEHAELCLSRAANHSLSIGFTLSERTVQQFYNRILPNLGRCPTLSLEVDRQYDTHTEGDADCVAAFDRFKRTQLPFLEYFRLSGPYARIPELDIFAVHPESPLKEMDLYCWHDLSLATPPPPTLKRLSMVCVQYYHSDNLDPSQFFEVLLHVPALEHLEVCSVQFQSVTDTTPPAVPLKCLKYLRIEQDCPFTLHFLKRVEMPSLQKFHVGEPHAELYEPDCPHAGELEMLIPPLAHRVLRALPSSPSLRLEVACAPVFVVKVRDDIEDYMKIFFSINIRTSPTLSLQWLNRVLQDAPRSLPLHITFGRFPESLSDQSLVDTVISLPCVRSIAVLGCSDVNSLVRSLGSKSPPKCPLPELTDLVFDSIDVPMGPGVIEWVQNSRTPNVPPINFLINTGATSTRLAKLLPGEEEEGESDSEAW